MLLALILSLLHTAPAQVSRSAKVDKGPRALGLLELPANGKGRLIPICIMVDGAFYDASAYKASPVPMALWSETVYDVQKTGISQGLFTVGGALENPQTKAWIAEGRFETAAELAAKAKKSSAPPSKPRGMDEDSGPPVLRHSAGKAPSPEASDTKSSAPQTSSPTPPSAASAEVPTPSDSASTKTAEPQEAEDPNRPVLKRGKQPAKSPQPETAPSTSKEATGGQKATAKIATNSVQLIPAISDAAGPEPRNYAFVMKTGEEQEFQKKILVLASDAVRAREKVIAQDAVVSPAEASRRGRARIKPVPPKFSNVEMRVFDLTNSNDAVLVLTATAEDLQRTTSEGDSPPQQFFVTVIARQDLNGDLHKVFTNVTDNQHLDVTPRWDLIDAVDANGDGAGELLFRKVSDASSVFGVYRVIGDQLYPLFEGSAE